MSGTNEGRSKGEVMGRKSANGANAGGGGGGGRRDWGRAARALAATAEAELLDRADRELEREPGGYLTVAALGEGRSERKVGRLDGEDREWLAGWFESVVEEAWEEAGTGAKLRLRLWGPGGRPAGSASFEVGGYVEGAFEQDETVTATQAPVPRAAAAVATPAPCPKCASFESRLAERNALVALLEKEVMTARRDAERWRAQYERIDEPYRRLRAEHAALRQEVDEAARQINEIVGEDAVARAGQPPSSGVAGGRVAPWVRLARRAG